MIAQQDHGRTRDSWRRPVNVAGTDATSLHQDADSTGVKPGVSTDLQTTKIG
jgi:hypothetical protein